MSWRNLVIANPTALSCKQQSLLCRQEVNEDLLIPLEDIASITLDTPQVSLTAALLSHLAKNGIVLISCDEKHMPNGVMLAFNTHSRILPAIMRQVEWSKPFKKRMRQVIVRQKINNQAMLLRRRGAPDVVLEALSKSVASGDPKNVEAQAARRYFSNLFVGFKRGFADKRNAALNYGYAIIRAAIARELTYFGFQPALGLFHHSELNSFNLADDLLEPFRPFVDGWACNVITNEDEEKLNLTERQEMTRVLQLMCHMEEEEHRLQTAIHLCVKSLHGATAANDHNIISLPHWRGNPVVKIMEE